LFEAMPDLLARAITHEANWLPFSMAVSILTIAALVRRHAGHGRGRHLVAGAMNLFFGATIVVMACGHLLAVSVKLAQGTLRGSPLLLYAIGAVIAAPSWTLARYARRPFVSDSWSATTAVLLNVWLAGTLLALGLHNLPLAAPALFNIGYLRHSRPAVGHAMLGLAVAVNTALFAGALVFLASGQSFEQFSGME
jgi:hypothetical protein